jgi:hypothetical protein
MAGEIRPWFRITLKIVSRDLAKLMQVVIGIELPNAWYYRSYFTQSSVISGRGLKRFLKFVLLCCMVSLLHFEGLVAATCSCLDIGRKTRGLNSSPSKVISRATKHAPGLYFPADSLDALVSIKPARTSRLP